MRICGEGRTDGAGGWSVDAAGQARGRADTARGFHGSRGRSQTVHFTVGSRRDGRRRARAARGGGATATPRHASLCPTGVNPKKARTEMRAETARERAARAASTSRCEVLELVKLAHGRHRHAGVLGAREALKVLGLRMEGGGFSRHAMPLANRGARCRTRGTETAETTRTCGRRGRSASSAASPWSRIFTAFAALAALAAAASRVGTTGWEGARVRRALVASRGEIPETETRSSVATKGAEPRARRRRRCRELGDTYP